MKYDIQFQFVSVAEVEIDENDSTQKAIAEMVDFWSDADERLEANGGDYTKAFLKQLGAFVVRNGRGPDLHTYSDEGWLPLDGTHGIKLETWPLDVDEDTEIDIFPIH